MTRAALVTLLGLLLVLQTPPVSAQPASVLEAVRECDLLAAHPGDADRMAEGVADDRIVPRLAIRACEAAVAENAGEARFPFQLGRALLAANRRADAAVQFEKAAQAGSAAAWAYVGDAHQFGFRGPVDFQKAYAAYGKALEGGFERAKSLMDMMVFSKDAFTVDLLTMLYTGQAEELRAQSSGAAKWPNRAYVFAFTQKVSGECDQVLSPVSFAPLFRYRFQGWNPEADAGIDVDVNTAAAEFDAQNFVRRHGCDGPVTRQLFSNLNEFLKGF